MRQVRVAYFPDSFHEINGVAHTSRSFVDYAQRRKLPFLCVRAGARATPVEQRGNLRTLELQRSAAAVSMEKDLAFDPLFWRHADAIEDELHRFEPDLLHMTGPSELGMFAAYFAWKLKIPLAASWHTNVHEYAARRLVWLTRLMPGSLGEATAQGVEGSSLEAILRFYALAGVLFAPNVELCRMLAERTGRPCHLMQRGVDTTLFSPRYRPAAEPLRDPIYILGYVGRLSVEKNVTLLPRVEQALRAAGYRVRFLIVGHGSEEERLRREMPSAEFAGILRGEDLARAYARMDVFVFPSHTDTFGNVVLEALASGVPAVVTPDGGPRSIVREGADGEPGTGIVAADCDFAEAVGEILQDPARLARMRKTATAYAATCSWDAVFDRVYAAYSPLVEGPREDLCRLGAGADSSPGWERSSPTYTP